MRIAAPLALGLAVIAALGLLRQDSLAAYPFETGGLFGSPALPTPEGISRIAGRVIDPEGRPAAGAEIELRVGRHFPGSCLTMCDSVLVTIDGSGVEYVEVAHADDCR